MELYRLQSNRSDFVSCRAILHRINCVYLARAGALRPEDLLRMHTLIRRLLRLYMTANYADYDCDFVIESAIVRRRMIAADRKQSRIRQSASSGKAVTNEHPFHCPRGGHTFPLTALTRTCCLICLSLPVSPAAHISSRPLQYPSAFIYK
jgi:hypothetical protein